MVSAVTDRRYSRFYRINSMQQLLLATHNTHKTREFREILGGDFDVSDLSDSPDFPETPETGASFKENAVLKAIAASKTCFGVVMADDSGLEVDALGGAPGIFSARYAGDDATNQQNLDKLQRELARIKSEPERRARFRCVIALARAGELLGTFEGAVEGIIADAPRGVRGFGYDPVFVPNDFNQTFAELPPAIKNQISHRAKALAALLEAFRSGKIVG